MARNKIFIDTNVFVALARNNDSCHKMAINLIKFLDSEDSKIVISNFIFGEIITILSMREGKKLALEVGDKVLGNPNIDIIQIDKSLNQQAWEIFQEVDRKNISFVDCSTVAVMKEYDIDYILTFDETDFGYLGKKYRFKIFR